MIPNALPMVTTDDIEAVRKVLESAWLTTGPRVKEFETAMAGIFFRHCIAVSSATAGLHLALAAAGVGPGWGVIVPTWTFTATAEAVEMAGAVPIFADVDCTTLNLTIANIADAAQRIIKRVHAGEQGLCPKRIAIMPVHMAGRTCEMDLINAALGREHTIIEDAAHAFGASYEDGRLVGGSAQQSDAIVFSFYATKGLTTLGEGGLVCVRDQALAQKIRRMRFHGLDREAWDRQRGGDPSFEIVSPGFKYNMTDAQAAMGLTQLDRCGDWLNARRQLAAVYSTSLYGLPIELPELRAGHSFHLYQVKLPKPEAWPFIDFMRQRGIACSVHYRPLHRNAYWRDKYKLDPRDFPQAESLVDRVVSLPMWAGLTGEQQLQVVETVKEYFR